MEKKRVYLPTFALSLYVILSRDTEILIVSKDDDTWFYGSMMDLIEEATRKTPVALPMDFVVLDIRGDNRSCKFIIEEIDDESN